jgi:hypothetical protein
VSEDPKARAEARRGLPLLAIVLAAIGAKLSHQWAVAADPSYGTLHGNAAGFWRQAQAILGGDWSIGNEVFFYGPLYPYFLAFCWWLGGAGSMLAPRLLQVVLSLALAWGTFAIARRAFDRGSALAASALVLFYWPSFFFESLLVATTLSTFLLVVAIGLTLSASGASPGRQYVALFAAGAAAGLACWGRGNVLLLLPVLATWLALDAYRRRESAEQPRRRLRAALAPALAFTIGASALILPVTLRNAVVAGDRVLLVSQGGINFFIGNNAQAFGTFHLPESAGIHTDADGSYFANTKQIAERESGASLRPSEISSYWFRRGLRWIGEEPTAALALTWRKARLLLDAYEVPIHRNAAAARELSWAGRHLPLPGWGLLLPLALGGLVLSPARRRGQGLLLVLALVYSASVVAFFVCDRYRFPLALILAPHAGYAVATLAGAARERLAGRGHRPAGRRRFVVAAGVMLAAAVLTNDWLPGVSVSPLTPELRARYTTLEHQRRGKAWERIGASEKALVEFELAVAATPGHVPSRRSQARLLAERGDVERAAEILEVVVSLVPDNAGAVEQLARLCLGAPPRGLGRPREALLHATHLLDLRPADEGAKQLLEQARQAAGD